MSQQETTRDLPEQIPFPPASVVESGRRFYRTHGGGIREILQSDSRSSLSKKSENQTDLNAPLAALSIQAGLDPYTGILDARSVRHLLRRVGFGASPSEITALVGMQATAAVDALVDAALNDPHPDTPSWVDYPLPPQNASEAEWMLYNDWVFQTLDQFRYDWMKLLSTNGLREKLTLFWHDHFATSQDKYYHVQLSQRYVELMRTHALGNFKQFVSEMGLDPAMMIFLDGIENQAGAPNENYARELCELFTMGITDKNSSPNYTENDVKEIARGLTGYVITRDLDVVFISQWHDNGLKTVFGQQGNWGYDEIIDIVFAQREAETAWYICKKLYQEFVYEAIDESVVQAMADLFIANNWDISIVVRTLLKSAHFFDSQVIGARISSPTEMMMRYFKELADDRAEDGHFILSTWAGWGLEQVLTLVPSVNGWPRHRNWISTTTMPERWAVCGWLIWVDKDPSDPNNPIQQGRLDIRQTLEGLVDLQDPHAVFRIAPALVEHLFAVPIESLDIEELSSGFAGDLLTHPLPDFVVNGPAYE
ncbi:MAG: DUF1800 domain-containing protein, partial [Rhodothermales bacterium]|nr:DUF1800 domain-containing protein [Rhodothermales bacterium]